MDTDILKENIAPDLVPMRLGGVTLYPASALDRIFDWAESVGRPVEWIEGAFYDPVADQGQHSLSYIRERGDGDASFQQECLDLVSQIELEAKEIGKKAYFEIGVRLPTNGS